MKRCYTICLLLCLTTLSCQRSAPEPAANVVEEDSELPEKLSALELFEGPLAEHRPGAHVFPYELRTPLFSDYTLKYRFIKLPCQTSMLYRGDDETIDFPVGTIIAKTFAYPYDQRNPDAGRKLLETRILRKQASGWQGVSYQWNDEQTEAFQKLAGTVKPSTWTHFDGKPRSNAYIIPNANQCKGCHGNNNEPIGPKPRNISSDGVALKMLYFEKPIQPAAIWNQPETGSLEQRAHAWLDINCAHCHNPAGPARQSGLDLRLTQTDPVKRGVMKLPVAAGRGSGGRHYDIVPGKPDDSILLFRLESTEPGIMMPELPRRLVDEEGVRLIREWISSLRLP
ncbi:MAG: SO2930 family diheme c-type cytochrome [Gemmatales bacterium]